MRPIRLELEGFTSFRENTVVEFAGADLFVLWGPTGSGKSSLIDAMTFALYGSVPRYQNESLVHPAISQGKVEARVRFDFSLGDTEYTVVRVVRRQKRGDSEGAVAKEVRLQSGDEVLAGNGKELAREIKRLFGLSFSQFTTCVVLPQGEFARFLQASGAERQDLLKDLMRLSVYDRMGRAARKREGEAKTRIQVLDAKLDELGFATTDRKREESKHLRALKGLTKTVSEGQAELTRIEAELTKTTQRQDQHRESAELLAGLELPRGVETLHKEWDEAREQGKQQAEARIAAQAQVETAEAGRVKLAPDALALRTQLQAHDDRAKQATKVAATQAAEAKFAEAEATAIETQQASAEAVEEARARVAAIAHAHAAHALAEGLAAGEPCPVCHRDLEESPQHSAPPGLEVAQKQLEKASALKIKADSKLQAATAKRGTAAGELSSVEARMAELDTLLAGAAEPKQLQAQIAAISQADQALETARNGLKKSQNAEAEATSRQEEFGARLRASRARFAEARDALASLRPDPEADEALWRPPPADEEDLVGSWRALLAWAGERRGDLLTRIEGARNAAASGAAARSKELEALDAACAAVLVSTTADQSHAEAVARELARSEAELERIDDALERATNARAERAQAKKDSDVASALARHLRANAFERWLLQEAFAELVSVGSQRLYELSSGDYSFALDEKLDFQIVDHRNADESRSAKTLSGGETFLASLALALTLAEQVAGLATEGAARLESIFLDEGFGTLDPDTLDTVASCIEELGARGRMVGLVTHVRDLADRVPVQFEVSKTAAGSVVTRSLQ